MDETLSQAEKRRLGTVSRRLLSWFEGNGRSFPWRSPGSTAYERVLVEVLLRRTRAGTVAAMYGDFFSRFPDWKSICSARSAKLERVLTPLGLVRRRVGPLKELACLMDRQGGIFPSGRTESTVLSCYTSFLAAL